MISLCGKKRTRRVVNPSRLLSMTDFGRPYVLTRVRGQQSLPGWHSQVGMPAARIG